MPSRLPPYDLVQSQIDALPKEVCEWVMKDSSICETLWETLQEYVGGNRLHPAIATNMMKRLMPAYIRAFHALVFDKDEMQVKMTNCEYRSFDNVYTFWAKDVTLVLQSGQPNPMDGYVAPDPAAKKIKGKGKASDPYDLTQADDDIVAQPDAAAMVPQVDTSFDALTSGSKRRHSSSVPPSTQLSPIKTSKKTEPFTIVIPRLKIVMHPSAFFLRERALPGNQVKAFRDEYKELETQRLIEAGEAKAVKHRNKPNKPRKKKKTDVKVKREDLEEDEPDLSYLVQLYTEEERYVGTE